jgi:diaminohydroxyphosphoribosylaminopyrimidine deaminase/5-amino-6-(5-phosphoribosylamino)uracil reductase
MSSSATAAVRDERFMRLALAQARRGLGRTSPNPHVGAVVVRGDEVVGLGYHTRAGAPHAEQVALEAAGEAARGAEVFVNLEPCSHHGRNSPCAERLIAAGARRVVAGVVDPNPLVDGRGLRALRAAGIEVACGVLEAECAHLNAPFFKYIRTRRPWVTAKYATTLDGHIATATGDSQWISGPRSRHEAHRLRDRHDAILVGAATVRRDDPRLTTRGVPGGRDPVRVVLDPRGTIDPDAALLRVESAAPTWVVCAEGAAGPLTERLGGRAEVIGLPLEEAAGGGGAVLSVDAVLAALGARNVMTVLVEGGGATLGHFFSAGQIDEVVAFVAPRLVGGGAGVFPIGGAGVETVAQGATLDGVTVRRLGDDLMIGGRVRR